MSVWRAQRASVSVRANGMTNQSVYVALRVSLVGSRRQRQPVHADDEEEKEREKEREREKKEERARKRARKTKREMERKGEDTKIEGE